MSIRTSIVNALLGTVLIAIVPRAQADPAPRCDSRFHAAFAQVRLAAQDAREARTAGHIEQVARTLHLTLLADMAARAADSATHAEVTATRAAVDTLIGRVNAPGCARRATSS